MNVPTERSLLVKLIAFGLQACCAAVACGQFARGPSSSPTAAVPVGSREVSAEIDTILWWLPEDTETIVISTGRVPVGHAHRMRPSPTTLERPARRHAPVSRSVRRPTISVRGPPGRSVYRSPQWVFGTISAGILDVPREGVLWPK